jgi:uncharacterized protein (DUF2235 family)
VAKNVVVCCDGTGNEIDRNLSNVLKLFRICIKDDRQRVYYGAGIGTIGSSDAWARWRQNAKSVFQLATGYGLDDDILGAYEFICRNYDDDDTLFLFGFSRGSYTARAVAAVIHLIGLLPSDQLNLRDYGLTAYKQASEQDDFSIAWQFSKVAGCRAALIKFLGCWDTVASVIVPRPDRIIPQLLTLPYTRTNPSVEVFRHAMAIDERRRMFRLNRWTQPQPFVRNPFDRSAPAVQQDIKQVWFAGVHADIGGGYPEVESGLAKFPLDWMVSEAVRHGLRINTAMRNEIVLGEPRIGARTIFVRPDAAADAHDSLTFGWRLLEWIPKPVRWREWPPRQQFAGWYIPCGEPRMIENAAIRPVLHQSVIDRQRLRTYTPVNFPSVYEVEPYDTPHDAGAA